MHKIDKSFIISIGVIIFIYVSSIFITGAGLPCLIRKYTHLYCPGCGITRMFISLFSLNFYQAFRYNPLVFTYLLLYIIYTLINVIRVYLKKAKISLNNGIYIILIVVAIAFGILRNIPEFSYLAPTIVK